RGPRTAASPPPGPQGDAGETDDLNAQADDAGHVGGAESLRVVATGVSNFPWRLRVRERVDTASGHADIKAKVSCGRQHLPLQALGYDGDSGTVDSDQGTDLVQDVLRLLRSETPARVREPPVVGARQAANHALAACQDLEWRILPWAAKLERSTSSWRRTSADIADSTARARSPAGEGDAGPAAGTRAATALAAAGQWQRARRPGRATAPGAPGLLAVPELRLRWCGRGRARKGPVRRRRRRIREAVELSVIAGIPFEAPNLIEFNGLDSLALAEKDILERFDRQLRKLIASPGCLA
ncbi:unnamed protein product, partial [Prorocentrum cordatum]